VLQGEAQRLLREMAPGLGRDLVTELLDADQSTEAGVQAQRSRVAELKRRLHALGGPAAAHLGEFADALVKRSVWLVGGDGWAYDIGYGGLDHVLAQDRDVNILVLDTEVYSNTGGQQSKATPLGAAAKFAMAGKAVGKKDLGLEAMSYYRAYVARVALGADMNQVVQAFVEAESYPGPSLIIAYSPCIAHGYDLRYGAEQSQLAVKSGVWPLYRFDPRRIPLGLPPLVMDSKQPTVPVSTYQRNETRFRMVEKLDPARFKALAAQANGGCTPSRPLSAARRDHDTVRRWWRNRPWRSGGVSRSSDDVSRIPAPHPFMVGASPLVVAATWSAGWRTRVQRPSSCTPYMRSS
jgi:pyruvate-ferredoxin/flavodoxin oxidoreductase